VTRHRFLRSCVLDPFRTAGRCWPLPGPKTPFSFAFCHAQMWKRDETVSNVKTLVIQKEGQDVLNSMFHNLQNSESPELRRLVTCRHFWAFRKDRQKIPPPPPVGFSTYVRYYSRRCLGHFWHQTRVGHQLEWEPPPSAPENSSWPSTWVGASPSQPPKPRAAWCGIWSSRKTRVGHQLESIWGPFSFIFGFPWKLELATDLSWSQANLSRFGGAFSFILGGPGNSSLSPTWIELGSF